MHKDDLYGWENDLTTEMFRVVLKLKTVKECEDFFRDLMTLHEIEEMANRFRIAKLVDKDLPYLDIADKVGVSTSTVTRVAHWLKHGRGGYKKALDRG